MNRDPLLTESGAVIRAGSQSFAAASRLFDRRTRAGAHLLYAWCRHCDDVIDGQVLGHRAPDAGRLDAGRVDAPARARLATLEAKTRAALAGAPPEEPAFVGLHRVVAAFGIDPRWPLEHLAGFEMDVTQLVYPDLDALLVYAWRVAGVVGVMMASVMGIEPGDVATLRRAQDLGLAFQLTNIARDVGEDARAGRLYLPADSLARHGVAATPEAISSPRGRRAAAAASRELLAAAEPFYASARGGLAALPWRAAWAVAAAGAVYRQIGVGVARAGEAALDRRIGTSGAAKARLIAGALGAVTTSRLIRPAPRPSLWERLLNVGRRVDAARAR